MKKNTQIFSPNTAVTVKMPVKSSNAATRGYSREVRNSPDRARVPPVSNT